MAVGDVVDGWSASKYHWFLDNYWQKKPLLIRNAIPSEISNKYTKDDVLSLVTDEDVESRLINKRRNKFLKSYGPFDDNELNNLPAANWTVLVQEVDRHIPWIADLWTQYFNFIPLWRRDDVMVSYSAKGGGIGGHIDNYDVFLIQGSGEKEWSIENKFVNHNDEIKRELPNSETRLLADFHSDQLWVLKPGDILYLPPRIPHRGISLTNDCVTISMGFRSPSYESLHAAFCQYHCQKTDASTRFYSDPDLGFEYNDKAMISRVGYNIGLISDTTITKVSQKMQEEVCSLKSRYLFILIE